MAISDTKAVLCIFSNADVVFDTAIIRPVLAEFGNEANVLMNPRKYDSKSAMNALKMSSSKGKRSLSIPLGGWTALRVYCFAIKPISRTGLP